MPETPLPSPSGRTSGDANITEQMSAVPKDPTRPTHWSAMTLGQLDEQLKIALRRIHDAFVILGQATPVESVQMGLEETLANAAALLEGQIQARADYDQFYAMKQEQDRVVVYLRTEYAKEIAAGRHNGRQLSDVIIGYLEIERSRWLGRFWRLFI